MNARLKMVKSNKFAGKGLSAWTDPRWNGTPVATIESIDPERANAMLTGNTMNRPVSEMRVKRYAQIMAAGRWKLNGETIVFASTGELLTGQHRLFAVIESGATIQTLVVRGVDRSAFDSMDQGMKKSNADILSIGGVENASTAAATARWVALYKERNPSSHLLVNSNDITMQHIEAVMAAYGPEITAIARQCHGTGGKRYFPSPASGMMVLAAKKWGQAKVDQFIEQVKTGAGLTPGDPALTYRNRIAAQTSGARIDPRTWALLAAKMIIAHCTGKSMKVFKPGHEEPFPSFD